MKVVFATVGLALATVVYLHFADSIPGRKPPTAVIEPQTMGDFTLKSSSFKEGDTIPIKHVCDGDDVSPMLEIRNAPAGVSSFALIVDDPDATRGVPWDHWLLWNISSKTQYIPEDTVPGDAVEGRTSFGHNKYNGPCPPRGSNAHRYYFKLYALDAMLALPPESTSTALVAAMQGHIIAETHLMGRYAR
jgi:Raf kinase inhibitor-like YbhB/YbcL family protein